MIFPIVRTKGLHTVKLNIQEVYYEGQYCN
jgi:hypothetical protein